MPERKLDLLLSLFVNLLAVGQLILPLEFPPQVLLQKPGNFSAMNTVRRTYPEMFTLATRRGNAKINLAAAFDFDLPKPQHVCLGAYIAVVLAVVREVPGVKCARLFAG